MIEIDEISAFQNKPQQIEIQIKNISDARELTITNEDLIEGSFSLNRYCVNGDFVQPGGCIQSEVTFSLENHNGRFSAYPFSAAYIDSITVSVDSDLDPDTTLTCALGRFDIPSIGGARERRGILTITARDFLDLFDRPVDWSDSRWEGSNSRDFVTNACSDCDTTYKDIGLDGLNSAFVSTFQTDPILYRLSPSVIESTYGRNLTYRQILIFACALNGVWGFKNESDHLAFMPALTVDRLGVKGVDPFVISPAQRFESNFGLRQQVNSVSATSYYNGVRNVLYPVNAPTNNQIRLSANPFLYDYPSAHAAVQELYKNVYQTLITPFSYVSFQASTLPFPNLFPGDPVRFSMIDGSYRDTLITHYTYKLNGRTQLMAVGL